MLSSLRLALLLVFFALPLLEIMLLIKAGEVLGFWPTISLLIAAAVLGFLVIREQGLSMVSRMLGAMNEGKLPFEPMLDSYALITAGFLLIVPGFLTDA
ncbi:MAG TPA: FxsA family protein, partial [Hyphomicrobium sp.]